MLSDDRLELLDASHAFWGAWAGDEAVDLGFCAGEVVHKPWPRRHTPVSPPVWRDLVR